MTQCKCTPGTWTDTPSEICGDYRSGEAGFCQECWHDEACHSTSWEQKIRADERAKVLAEVRQRLGL